MKFYIDEAEDTLAAINHDTDIAMLILVPLPYVAPKIGHVSTQTELVKEIEREGKEITQEEFEQQWPELTKEFFPAYWSAYQEYFPKPISEPQTTENA